MRSLASCREILTNFYPGDGGGGILTTLWFSENSERTQGKVISAQVTWSGQATVPPKLFMIAQWLQFLGDLYETTMS